MLEEKVIASWTYTKGSLDAKTASLCYLAANLAAGASEAEVREAISFAIRANAAKTHADILKVYEPLA